MFNVVSDRHELRPASIRSIKLAGGSTRALGACMGLNEHLGDRESIGGAVAQRTRAASKRPVCKGCSGAGVVRWSSRYAVNPANMSGSLTLEGLSVCNQCHGHGMELGK